MRQRYLTSPGVLTGVIALASLAALRLAGQNPATAPKPAPAKAAQAASPANKTAWGDPNLMGTWFVMADVPLERSAANANKEFLTDEEIAEIKKEANIGVTGSFMPVWSSFATFGKNPD